MFAVLLNVGGGVLNLVLYKVYKNPINLGCAYINLFFAAMFYAFTIPVLSV